VIYTKEADEKITRKGGKNSKRYVALMIYV
jgi:hypothetical protein